MTDFWTAKMAEIAPAPELPRADGAAYRAHRRMTSGSRLYNEPLPPQARQSLYVESGYSLENYQTAVLPAKFERRPGEGVENWERRVRQQYLNHLPDDQKAALLAAIADARAQESGMSHEQLRAGLDARDSGTGIGIGGAGDSPYARAQVHGRFGGGSQVVEKNGHLANQIAMLTAPQMPSRF